MTRSMQVKNGDLVLFGDSVQMVSGRNKLEQDLSIWLTERYGVDRFHRLYGSTLDSHIGGVIRPDTAMEIRNEVQRVLQNYQTLQIERLRENPGVYHPAELLDRIIEVEVVQDYDAFIIEITYASVLGDPETLTIGREV